MIRVLHLRDTDRVCGPGKTILETACRVDTSRFQLSVGLFMLDGETGNQYSDALEARGVDVIPLKTKSQYSPHVIEVIVRAVKHRGFDIIHSHEYKSDILACIVARKCGIPIVTTAHGWITNSLKSKLYIWAGTQTFRFFDRVVAVSPTIREEVLRYGVREQRVELIYNAIVVENYILEDHDPGHVRARFGIPESATLIGNIGRLSPEKGQIEFLKAAKQLLEKRQDNLYFVLVGDGPDRVLLEQFVKNNGLDRRVFFTGYERDVRLVYKDLDMLALTSYTEGFPNVILESLCMNTPVLAADVGGVASIVENRKTGILVSDHDWLAVERGLAWMLAHRKECKVMVRNGQAKIQECFEFHKRVEKVQDLYEKVLFERKHGN